MSPSFTWTYHRRQPLPGPAGWRQQPIIGSHSPRHRHRHHHTISAESIIIWSTLRLVLSSGLSSHLRSTSCARISNISHQPPTPPVSSSIINLVHSLIRLRVLLASFAPCARLQQGPSGLGQEHPYPVPSFAVGRVANRAPGRVAPSACRSLSELVRQSQACCFRICCTLVADLSLSFLPTVACCPPGSDRASPSGTGRQAGSDQNTGLLVSRGRGPGRVARPPCLPAPPARAPLGPAHALPTTLPTTAQGARARARGRPLGTSSRATPTGRRHGRVSRSGARDARPLQSRRHRTSSPPPAQAAAAGCRQAPPPPAAFAAAPPPPFRPCPEAWGARACLGLLTRRPFTCPR